MQTQANGPIKLRGFSEIKKQPVAPASSFWPAPVFYALLLYAGLLLLPTFYEVVTPGLDASWAFALNHFIHTGYKFGSDLVFTYGPLGFIAVPEHIRWNLPVAFAIRFAVWGVLLWQIDRLWTAGQPVAAYAFVLSLILGNKLYFYYWDYLLIAVVLVLLASLMHEPAGYVRPVILALLVGIAFLVKPTVFLMALLLIMLYCVHRLREVGRSMPASERAILAATFLIGPVAYLLFYNPSLGGLYGYIKGGSEISKGFAAAMSLDTNPHDASVLTGTCLIMGLSVAVAIWRRTVPVAGGLMVIAAAWVAFRHGFVRSDASHTAEFFAFAILVFAFFLALLKRNALVGAYFTAFIVFSFLALTGVADRWSPLAAEWWSPGVNLSNALDFIHWNREMARLDHAADSLFRATPAATYASQISSGTVFAFPWDLASAAHQNAEIVPLYVTQAYSAHTRYLDEMSAQRIQSAPKHIDHVVLEWIDIDSRNELMDLPATWMALFANFTPQARSGESLLLARRPEPLHLAYTGAGEAEYRPDTWVSVPRRSLPIAMSIDLQPTLWGSVLLATYKVAPIVLEVRKLSGSIQWFRVTADVLSSPSFVNCLPLSFNQLTELWSANLAKDPVVGVRLTGRGLQDLRSSGYRFYGVEGTAITVAGAVLPRP